MLNNSIRFATDSFGAPVEFVEEDTQDPEVPDTPAAALMKTALLKSNVPLDCSDVSAVNNFIVEGDEPTGSSRRVIFKIDDAYYKFSSGVLISYTSATTFAGIIKNGNKISTLLARSNITDFVGKKIYPIIALQAPSDAEEFPTIKLGLNVSNSTEKLTSTKYSPVYTLGDDTQNIISIEPNITTTGSGSVVINVRLHNNGSWSSYMSLSSAANKSADKLQFQYKYTVTTTDGSDSAQIDSIVVTHTGGQVIASGDACNIFSVIADYDHPLKNAYCLVRHAPLIDSKIEVYVNFLAAPKHRELINLGTANGSDKTFTLEDSDVVASSIQIFANGSPVYNFAFNTQASTVTVNATSGAVITASYDYDYGSESWKSMTAEEPLPYNDDLGSYATRFSRTNDGDERSIANVRIRLVRLSGSATESLGKATGKTQLFTLAHKPKPSTISFTNSVKFSFDETTGILSLTATKNTVLSVSYDWLGDSPTVYSFAAGFSV